MLQFDTTIHTVLNCCIHSHEPIVVFKSGAAVSLSAALENRKKVWCGPISSDAIIRDCFSLQLEGSHCIAIITTNTKVRFTSLYAYIPVL